MAPTRTSQATEMALVKQELHQINGKLTTILSDLDRKYAQQTELALVRIELGELRRVAVTQDQHWPVKMLVFGYTSLLLVTVVGAIAALVIRSPT